MSIDLRQIRGAQDSFDPREWVEAEADERLRRDLTPHDPEPLKRALFPFSGVLRLEDAAYQLPKGQYFKYVRAKRVPSILPFEGLAWTSGGGVKLLAFHAHELALLPPDASVPEGV